MSKKRVKREEGLAKARALSLHELFRDVPDASLRELEKNSQVQDCKAGHVFFHAGGDAQILFLLESGRVETYRTSGRKKLIVAELKPPSVFGEMGCLGAGIYHCSAQATETSRVRTIARADFDRVQREYPAVTRQLLDLVGGRFLNVLMDLDATSFSLLLPRIAKWLLERAEADCIENVTHEMMAQHLRVYRESVTAALGELRKAGIIAVERKRIRVMDRSRLERAARE